ncbi:MAG: ABC transporter permease subunit [Nitriliruptorales bacterium]|nr:ABC transporter permease subunit [Nitriliruptorales bacterium]
MAESVPVLRLPRVRIDWRELGSLQTLVLIGVTVLVAYLAIVPLGYLLWNTFVLDGSLTLENFRSAYASDAFGLWTMSFNSVRFAVGSTALSIVIGTSIAYLTVRTDVPLREFIFAASLIPLIIPGVLHTIAWIFIASPDIGWVNHAFAPLLGSNFFNIFSMPGMIFVEALNQAPLVFLLMYAAFRSMDPSLEESAYMSGASFATVLRRITLPLVRPTLYACVLIMLVLGLESFEVPTLLGMPSGIWVFTSRIYRVLSQFPVMYGEAGAYSITLLIFTTAGVFWQSRLNRRGKAFQTVTGKGFRPNPMRLGRLRWVATTGLLVYFFIAAVLPLLVLLYMSFQPYYTAPTAESFGRLTLENYRYTFSNASVLGALTNSVVLAISAATAVMLVMTIAAWLVVRSQLRGRWLIDNLAFLPITVPGLVMGVALLIVYLRVPLPIYGTLWILFIAYCTRYMPYGMRYAASAMYQISSELEESAQTSGASWLQTFRRILLPLIAPGFLAGWIYIVMAAVRELSSSVLLYSPGNEVLGVHLWEQWENGRVTELAAAGIILMLMLVGLVLFARKLGANVGVQQST